MSLNHSFDSFRWLIHSESRMGLLITGSHDSFTSQINLETKQTLLCCSQMNNSSAVALYYFHWQNAVKTQYFV